MKRLILIPIFLLGLVICHGQDKEAVMKVLATQQDAWNRGDIEGFMQDYWKSDSLMFVGKTAPVYGWQTTLDHYKKGYPNRAAMGQLMFDIIQVKILDPSNAFVMGGWKLKREKDEPGGYFTLWFRKINGEWKIVCDHTS